eukprot:TRINITY_DN9151_c0_g2_i5.p2 TRINITY_DN9151_c0_g2~~TRINITY_DN9151_c0_g2_i5.p2  ORF type:complete len:129 (+),score=25.50 TRINITY_DN9151_c0_g2_i5:165-551(+)
MPQAWPVERSQLQKLRLGKAGPEFTDWAPSGYLLGSHRDPSCPQGEAVAFHNSTEIGGLFTKMVECYHGKFPTAADYSELPDGLRKRPHQRRRPLMEWADPDEALSWVRDYNEVAEATNDGGGTEEEE